MRTYILLMSICLSSFIHAQNQINGVVIDEQGSPVSFASVSLLNADSMFVTGVTTGLDGMFQIETVGYDGILKVSYVGYATQYLPSAPNTTIRLTEIGVAIGDVVIRGNRPTYNMKGGNLVAQVENTVLGKLGDANDVLAQLPLIAKGEDGYTVVGRGAPLIYINNRLMRDAQELEQIKSSSIKDVKIELNPSSRYSAEVGAIIRITTLRPVGEGFGYTLSSYFKRSNRNAFTEIASLNYRHQGLDVFFNGQYNDRQQEQDQHDCYLFEFNNTPVSVVKSGVIGNKSNRNMKLTGGINYNFSESQLAGIRYIYDNTLKVSTFMDFEAVYKEGEAAKGVKTHQTLSTPQRWNHQLNAFYQNAFSEKWQLNLDATYADYRDSRNGSQVENWSNATTEVNYTSSSKSSLWALKVWNTHQLWGGVTEWGLEATKTKNDQDYQMLNEEIAAYFPSTSSLSEQNAQSLFMTYSYSFGRINTNIGLRYEHVNFDYETNGRHNDEASRSFNNLFPSLSLSYSHNGTTLSLAYRTIVVRPSYYQLRSETQYNNSYSAEGGNPELRPAYTNRLSLTARHHDFMFDATYNITKDEVIFYTLPVTARPMAVSTYTNHDMSSYDMTLTYSPGVGCWKPSFMAGLSGQVLHLDGTNHSGIGFVYQWQNIVTLPKKWIITCNLNGSSALPYQNIDMRSRFNCDIMVRKDIGNWQLTGGINDVFNTSRQRWSKEDNGVYYYKWNNGHIHGVYLRAVYSFNPAKSKFKGGQAGQSELNRL